MQINGIHCFYSEIKVVVVFEESNEATQCPSLVIVLLGNAVIRRLEKQTKKKEEKRYYYLTDKFKSGEFCKLTNAESI